MPKFEVQIRGYFTQNAWLEIEAESADQAKEIAIRFPDNPDKYDLLDTDEKVTERQSVVKIVPEGFVGYDGTIVGA